MARARRRAWWAALGGAACALRAAALPLSRPITRDSDVPSAGNKFLRRAATRDGGAPGRRASAALRCATCLRTVALLLLTLLARAA